jgi:hypothetical protein
VPASIILMFDISQGVLEPGLFKAKAAASDYMCNLKGTPLLLETYFNSRKSDAVRSDRDSKCSENGDWTQTMI